MCSRRRRILDQIPNLFQAFFDSGSRQARPAHCGPYRGYCDITWPREVPAKNQLNPRQVECIHGERARRFFDNSQDHEVTRSSRRRFTSS